MTKVILNGKEHAFKEGQTLLSIIESHGLKPQAIVAQVNDEIVAKDKYSQHPLNDGDRIELIKFMAGG